MRQCDSVRAKSSRTFRNASSKRGETSASRTPCAPKPASGVGAWARRLIQDGKFKNREKSNHRPMPHCTFNLRRSPQGHAGGHCKARPRCEPVGLPRSKRRSPQWRRGGSLSRTPGRRRCGQAERRGSQACPRCELTSRRHRNAARQWPEQPAGHPVAKPPRRAAVRAPATAWPSSSRAARCPWTP